MTRAFDLRASAGSDGKASGLSTSAPHAPDVPAWTPFRGPFQRWPRLADFGLAGFSFFMTLAMWSSARSSDGPTEVDALAFLSLLAAILGNAALYWRRRWPVQAHWVIIAASVFVLVAGQNSGIFAMAFSLYSLGRYTEDRRASLAGLCGALGVAAADLFIFSPPGGSVMALLMVAGIWYLGRRLRFRGEYLRLLKDRAEFLERQQSVEAEQAVARERTRIARELHDIVAHQVSLMTVQAGAAKTVADSDPKAAIEAMSSVEKAGRHALDELRHLLGVLRPGREDSNLVPQPGCAELPRLLDELREAGLKVELEIKGSMNALPARIDLAVYRILQEALTNVLKHAGVDATASVVVEVGPRGVDLAVHDNGIGDTRLPGAGHGITGMRERVHLLGGSLEAGALRGGGFGVQARLPMEERA